MNSVCIIKKEIKKYPAKEAAFRPSANYPEYLFPNEISAEENPVYGMVRDGLIRLGLDAGNIGKKGWNPLGHLIKPGDCVLLKPNLVLHKNVSGCGTDCLYTNPSVVAAMADYALIALKGTGRVVIGDAPLQECEFQTLASQSGYGILIDFYKKKGIDIGLVDFRNIKTYEKGGLHYLQEKEGENGVVVSLDDMSAFAGVSEERMRRLRITNYDPRILQRHHHKGKHEYNVSQHVLDADVIINMPKPKTHRKAGVTISLKNLVGINANKEFLPHHTLGSRSEGGDAYLNSSVVLEAANEILDIRNKLIRENEMALAEKVEALYKEAISYGMEQSKERYWEGSWHGNDTIWRTIVDLNRILLYADKTGRMTGSIQRRLFIVGDMVVSGEKEGPLEPVPNYPGAIVMGDDPVKFDRAVCSIMGFDYRDIPTLHNDELLSPDYPLTDGGEVEIISNYDAWNGKSMDEIRERHSLEFQPSFGWMEKLGNRYRERLYGRLIEDGNPVYIFGAGMNGIYAAEELRMQGIKVAAFCDNNPAIWGTEIIDGISCIGLKDADMGRPFVAAVRDAAVEEIAEQVAAHGGEVFGVLNKL